MKVGLCLSCYPELDKTWNDLAPLGLGYLASYARQQLPEIDVFISRDFQALLDAKSDIVGLTSVTHNIKYCIQQAQQAKDTLGCPVLIGGPHISLMPGILDAPFDIGIIGEGELTFVELLRLYQDTGKFEPQNLAKIEGIRYRDERGMILDTPPRAPIADLNQLPFPDRASTWKQWPGHPKTAVMMTSRGCPYDCYFCSTVKHWGRKYRYTNEEYVLRELEEIRSLHDPSYIAFFDDLFVGRKDRVLRIMEMIRERHMHETTSFGCFVRANLLDDTLMEAFARTNFNILNVGFESASENVLARFNKKSDEKNNRKAVELARKYGVKLACTFIIGSPGETREDVLKTLEFISTNMDVFYCLHISPLYVLPGTQIWEQARQVGVSETNLTGIALDPEDITDEYNFYMNRWPYLNEESMSREEMYNYLQIARLLANSVGKFGEVYHANKSLEASCKRMEEECRRMASADYIASKIPFSEIVKAKAKRRLRLK